MTKYFYDESHAVTFFQGDSIVSGLGSKNTWRDWHLIPVSGEIPIPNPPPPKTEYIDIPGSDGELDYSEVLAGIKYKNRTGSWDFYVVLGYNTWPYIYSEILNYLHGRRLKCVLSDDPEFYYVGRFSVNKWNSDEHFSKISIDYVLEPYKTPLNSTANYDWLWNELFSNTIYYGKFDVSGTKHRNFINNNASNITIGLRCTSSMTVTDDSSTQYNLEAGNNKSALSLKPGNNYFVFHGNGRVIVDYSIGKQL